MRDDDEFVEYVRADGSRLLRFAYLLVGNRADAEDLVQTCLVRVSRRWARIDASPHAYARQVLVRLATDRWRGRRLRPRDVPLHDDHVDGRDEFAEVDLRHALLDALRALPARQRSVLVLRHYEQLTEAETAEVLGISPGTVKTHNARGLAQLRALLASAPEGSAR